MMKIKVKDVLKRAERITVVHAYGDGTYLYDILVNGRAYSVRQTPDVINQFSQSGVL